MGGRGRSFRTGKYLAQLVKPIEEIWARRDDFGPDIETAALDAYAITKRARLRGAKPGHYPTISPGHADQRGVTVLFARHAACPSMRWAEPRYSPLAIASSVMSKRSRQTAIGSLIGGCGSYPSSSKSSIV